MKTFFYMLDHANLIIGILIISLGFIAVREGILKREFSLRLNTFHGEIKWTCPAEKAQLAYFFSSAAFIVVGLVIIMA